jgi:hypothetical protein
MKRIVLSLLLTFTMSLWVTPSHCMKPEVIPDVTGVYEGQNTRFHPDDPSTGPTTHRAIFYIWDQSERHFWGSIISDDGDDWGPRGYINGVIQPDNTIYFVNYGANYNEANSKFTDITNIWVMTNAIFIPAKGKTPKMLKTVGIRFYNNETTSGTYIHTNSPTEDDKNPGSPYTNY